MPHRPPVFVILITIALLSGCETLDSWQSSGAKSLDSLKNRLNMQA